MKTFTEPRAYETIENDVISNLSTHIKKDKEDVKNIIIVGAYHGYEINKFMKIYPNANFIAFEPYPKNFDILKNRFKNNSNVKCHNCACSDFNGTAEFYELNLKGNGSLLKISDKSIYKNVHNAKQVDVIEVQVKTLDSIIGNIPVDLLWADVQGNELKVLQGYNNKTNCLSMFLEVLVEGYSHESYEGNCHLSDLKEHLTHHVIHSMGLDNELNNGTGNSFWLRGDLIE